MDEEGCTSAPSTSSGSEGGGANTGTNIEMKDGQLPFTIEIVADRIPLDVTAPEPNGSWGKLWDDLAKFPEICEALNMHFLDVIAARGDRIISMIHRLKINPTSQLAKEVDY